MLGRGCFGGWAEMAPPSPFLFLFLLFPFSFSNFRFVSKTFAKMFQFKSNKILGPSNIHCSDFKPVRTMFSKSMMFLNKTLCAKHKVLLA
jgi:hypothetical protein